MARHPRKDNPGSWHHVINRGIARRPMFEDRVDVRYFLSRLAREVRRGRLELHAWCILTTHFHLLVRSPVGELSEALRRAQSEYSRHFNRRHRRDGTLIRGRFLSKPVESLDYRLLLVRYIDANPVRAGLSSASWRYSWGSARHYVRPKGPPWLERAWVEREVVQSLGRSKYDPPDYLRVFGRMPPAGAAAVIEERTDRPLGSDALESLIGAAPEAVLAWMRRKAELADGTPIGLPVLDAASALEAVTRSRGAVGEWRMRPRRREIDGWDLVEAGLLRGFAALSWSQLAASAGISSTTGQQRFQTHREVIEKDSFYAERFSEALSLAMEVCFGARE